MQPESNTTPKSVGALELEYNATPGSVAVLRICTSLECELRVDSWLGIVGMLPVVLHMLLEARLHEVSLTKLPIVSIARLLNRVRHEFNLVKSNPLMQVLLGVVPATPTTYGAAPRDLWRI